MPVGASSFKEAMQIGSECYHHLNKVCTTILLLLLYYRYLSNDQYVTAVCAAALTLCANAVTASISWRCSRSC
jgi:Enolase, C-terminal TIM barrel domain